MMHRRGGGKFRGGNRNYQPNDRFQGDHDDRGGNFSKQSEIKRKVSFKTNVRNYKGVNDSRLKAFLEDEEMMGEGLIPQGEGSSRSFEEYKSRRGGSNFRGRRKGSPVPRHMGGGGRLIQSPHGWYCVTIDRGSKYTREVVMRMLSNALAPKVFNPCYYKQDGDSQSSTFFVDDYNIAEQLMKLDRKLDMTDGTKMIIRVRGSVPQVRVDQALKDRMKNAMVKRYNVTTKALDLTKFHADPDLADIFCALFRPQVMTAAIEVISENIPDLQALNLNDNKLNLLDHLKIIPKKLPHLKILYLGNNKIFMMNSLDSLKGLPLVEIFLEGNPLKKRLRDEQYVSEIRKKFPKLLKLDGAELGPVIGFDVADDVPSAVLPPWKQAFLSNPAGSELVQKFLEQYFMLFDSDNRQQLLEAYHDQAVFSITATHNQHATHEERLHSYIRNSRNLIYPKGYDNRSFTLKRGKLNVVAMLSELPPSRHDPQSFAVDLTLFTPIMIVLTVTGLFKERSTNPKEEYARTFQKTMVIVPNNGGFCIKNELLHVNNASFSQARNAFKTPLIANSQLAPQQPPVASMSTQMPVSMSQPASVGTPDDSVKMQMIQAMSQQSNMNAEWSRKCLEETTWDFQRASFVFSELYKQNKIPPEAFIK